MRLQVWMKIGLICLLLAPAWTALAAEPLRADIGAFGGVDVFSSKSGLGNAANPKDVPGAGGLVGLRGGVVLLDNRLGVEAEFRSAFSSMQSGSGSATVYGLRIQGLWYFLTEGKVQPFALAGFGKEVLTSSKKYVLSPDWDNAGWLGVGARSPITHRVAVRADLRYVIGEPRPKDPGASSSNGPTSNFEGTLGVAYSFGGAPEDSDHDGIPDDVDKCPDQPEDKDGFEDDDGCPDPDNDHDGICDPWVARKGLSAKYANICKGSDQCSEEPETKNNYQDDDGCPDEVPAAVAKAFKGALEGIEFETGKATIRKMSFKVLDKAFAVLDEYKDVKVEISGHTDDRGDAEKNKKLSQDRAESVKKYLVDKGIAAERLSAVGFGAEKPIADNKTAKGQTKNRRIEFRLM